MLGPNSAAHPEALERGSRMNHRKQLRCQAVAALLLCFAQGFAYAGCGNTPDFESRVEGGPECFVIKTFRSTVTEQKPVLLVFLHGSVSRGGPADYFFRHAERWANDTPAWIC